MVHGSLSKKKNSRCSDVGLAELCWRCWARALWWSLFLWSEECGNRTNQRIGCRDTQSVLSILYKIKRHTSHSVSCTEETGRTENDTPGTKKTKPPSLSSISHNTFITVITLSGAQFLERMPRWMAANCKSLQSLYIPQTLIITQLDN